MSCLDEVQTRGRGGYEVHLRLCSREERMIFVRLTVVFSQPAAFHSGQTFQGGGSENDLFLLSQKPPEDRQTQYQDFHRWGSDRSSLPCVRECILSFFLTQRPQRSAVME
jgi:hypothetical protein